MAIKPLRCWVTIRNLRRRYDALVMFSVCSLAVEADLTLVLCARYRCWSGIALGVVIDGSVATRLGLSTHAFDC